MARDLPDMRGGTDVRPGMVVEFVGLSGVGKSTLIAEVQQRLRGSEQVSVHDARGGEQSGARRARTLGRGVVQAPTVALIALRAVRGQRAHVLRRYLRAIGFLSALRGSPGIHLIDEGPVKLLPTSQSFEQWWPALKSACPAPDLVVHVVCDSALRIRRVRELDRPHARNRTDEELRAAERYSLQRLEEAIRSTGAPVLVVDPTLDATAAATVTGEIERRRDALARTRRAR